MTHSYSYQLPHADTEKHIVFHLHKLTILIRYILLESCGSKLSYAGFQLTVVQNTAQLTGLYFEQDSLSPVDGTSALVTRWSLGEQQSQAMAYNNQKQN